jgi:hypothetical protein
MATAIKTVRTLVAAGTSNAAAGTTRGTLQLSTPLGGILTLLMTNGASAPTVQCTANVLIAHNAALPTAASQGVDWKLIYSVGGGVTANALTPGYWEFGPGVMNLEVEFTGNATNAVTVEAFVSEITSIG